MIQTQQGHVDFPNGQIAELDKKIQEQMRPFEEDLERLNATPGIGRTTQGNPVLRYTLVEAARAAARTKNTYLSAEYHRIAARRGTNRAAVATAQGPNGQHSGEEVGESRIHGRHNARRPARVFYT